MVEDLVSVRGLKDSDFDNPLRKFKGNFAGYETAPATGYEGTRVQLNFNEIEVLETTEPYNFPITTVNVGQSNKHKSRWGYLADSLAALLADDEDIKDAIGRQMTLVFCDNQDGRPAGKPIWNKEADPAEFPDKMVPTAVWIVTEMEGANAGGSDASSSGAQSAADWAEENIIGKTRADFNKWFFADAKCRKDTALQRTVTDKSFLNGLTQLGRIVENADGIFEVGDGIPLKPA